MLVLLHQYTKKLLGLVAEVCEACAEECEKHQHMEHCRLCAESCRKCAESVVRWLGKVKKERVLYTFQFFYLLYFLPIPLASNIRDRLCLTYCLI